MGYRHLFSLKLFIFSHQNQNLKTPLLNKHQAEKIAQTAPADERTANRQADGLSS